MNARNENLSPILETLEGWMDLATLSRTAIVSVGAVVG